jgi:hypothetical protein
VARIYILIFVNNYSEIIERLSSKYVVFSEIRIIEFPEPPDPEL